MITFEELEKFNKVEKNELESKKYDSLNENYEREIEAKIDRAIMLTRMSNPNKTEIRVSLGDEYSPIHVQHVLAKYEKEGYNAVYKTLGGIGSKDINPKYKSIEVEICWDSLTGNFYAAMKNPKYGADEISNIIVATQNAIYDELNHWFGHNWNDNITKAFEYIRKELYSYEKSDYEPEAAFLKFHSKTGEIFMISRVVSVTYPNKNLGIIMLDEYEQPVGSITVNLPDEKIEKDCGFIDVNNLGEGILEFLDVYNIAKPTGYAAKSGFCEYPLYKFNMSELSNNYGEEL